MKTRWWLLVLALSAFASHLPAQAAMKGKGLCIFGAQTLYLVESQLRSWPEGELVKDWGSLNPLAFDCDDGQVAVAFVGKKGGRVEILRLTDGEFVRSGQIELRFRPGLVRLLAGQLVVVGQRGKQVQLFIAPPDGSARGINRPLTSWPAALALAPDGTRLFVAQEATLKSFQLPRLFSREVFSFPGAIDAVASRTASSRMLVATGRKIMLVDLRDPRQRGALPVRAEARSAGRIVQLFWLDGGEMAAAVTVDPAEVMFLAGEHLVPAGKMALEFAPAQAVAQGPSRVLAMSATGDLALAMLSPQEMANAQRRDASQGSQRPLLPPPAAPAPHLPSDDPPPLHPKPAPRSSDNTAPLPASPVAPAEKSRPMPAESPVKPAPTLAGPSSAPAGKLPPSAAPAPRFPRARTVPSEKVAAPVLPPPASMAAPARESTQVPSSTRPSLASPPESPRLDQRAVPGGVIEGEVRGRADLVTELVALGPDNILKERARVAPEQSAGTVIYRFKELPAGRYRIQPVGADGASLASSPAFADVQVTQDAGERVDFRIKGRW